MRVLRFGVRDSPERGPEADANATLRFFARPSDASVLQRERGRADGKLRITIEPLQPVRRKKFLRHPIGNFRGTMGVEDRAVEAFHSSNPTFLRAQPIPETVAPD